MASQAQIDANRRNAQKSTGPKSEAGKEAASMNALKHGLCAQKRTLPHEDPAEFENLRQRLIADHKPATEIERILVDEIAQATLMLQRAGRFESSLFEVHIRALKLSEGRRDVPAADDDTAIALNMFLERNQAGYHLLFRYSARAESKFCRALDRLRQYQNDRLRRERQEQAQVTDSKRQMASFGERAAAASAYAPQPAGQVRNATTPPENGARPAHSASPKQPPMPAVA